ncbi:MAG: hypothetical protein AAGD25_12150 [Cyanobacteria bacterium P01_F01_bin.150]
MSQSVASENERTLKTLCRTIRLTSQRRFELIIVRCNYQKLQKRLLFQLHKNCPIPFEELALPRTSQTLYTLIETSYTEKWPEALCVWGFEEVDDLETLLLATNQVREEFRKNFKFPLVLWLNDQILTELIRLVPDFYSWATPLSFNLSNQELVDLIKSSSDTLFEHAFNASDQYPVRKTVLELAVNAPKLQELKIAKNELENRNYPLEAELQASINLALGRDFYRRDQLGKAEEKYQQSLAYWADTQQTQRSAMVLFHLGLCYWRKAYLERLAPEMCWKLAKKCFADCLESLESLDADQSQRLVANFIGQLGEVLQQLGEWDALQTLAENSLRLHQKFSHPARLARDWGFLASIALHHSDWDKTYLNAQKALQALEDSREGDRQRKGLYLWLLAQAQKQLGAIDGAIDSLEAAKKTGQFQNDPLIYIQILKALRDLYFQQGRYIEAFDVKQEQQAVESQYGYRAFIGASRLRPLRDVGLALLASEPSEAIAQELSVSVRHQDISSLLERLARPNYKLTIIHGQSGVGKSSMMSAGLVPTLKHKIMNSRDVVPVYCQFYGNWEEHLCQCMNISLEPYPDARRKELKSSLDILHQIRRNDTQNLLTVLIFDQFEEFFINCETPNKRRPFFDFLNQCFQLPFIKVLLVLREDYLHYLLEYERLPSNSYITQNILKQTNRFELINFSEEDTKEIITRLTERSSITWEPQLVDAVVHDLAQEQGSIRPIELQIVGAQLQAENINTLSAYEDKGTKDKLVQRYLETVVEDCGPENRKAANLILYLLLVDKDTRPQRTKEEIGIELKRLAIDLIEESNRLDLVLQIFVKSGLVFLLPETPSSRYQLVHDYLATFIRRQQQPDINARIAHLEREKKNLKQVITALEQEQEQRFKTEEELNATAKELTVTAQELKKTAHTNKETKKRLAVWSGVLGVAFLVVSALGLTAYFRLQQTRTEFDLEQKSWEALQQFHTQPLQGLIAAMNVGIQFQEFKDKNSETTLTTPIFALHKMLSNIRLQNTLAAHDAEIYAVAFNDSSNHYLVTGSQDTTARLWNLKTGDSIPLEGHEKAVLDVSFSPQGQHIATASADGTVKFWNYDGTIHHECSMQDDVLSIDFKKNGDFIAAIGNGKLQLRKPECELISEGITESKTPVFSIDFSDDESMLVAGDEKGSVSIWQVSQNALSQLKSLNLHNQSVEDVAFSPGDSSVVTVSSDGTGNIWRLQDDDILNFEAKGAPIRSITSISSQRSREDIVTSSDDNMARLWDLQGQEKFSFKGHRNVVRDVAFDSTTQTLATVSDDRSVKLWNLNNNLFRPRRINLLHESIDASNINVSSVSYDNNLLAASSGHGTIYILDFRSNTILASFSPYINQNRDEKHHILDLKFHPRNYTLVTASNYGQVILWSQHGEKIKELQKSYYPNFQDTKLAFDSTGTQVAIANSEGTVRIVNLEGESLDQQKLHNEKITDIKFNNDGGIIVTASVDQTACFWQLDTLPVCSEKYGSQLVSVAINPENTLVISDLEGTINIWHPTKQQSSNTDDIVSSSTRSINDIIFDKSGRFATASADGSAALWSGEGKPLAEFQGHRTPVQNIFFTNDAQELLTISSDGQIRQWEIQSLDDLLNEGCEWLSNYLRFRKNSKPTEEQKIVNFCSSISD